MIEVQLNSSNTSMPGEIAAAPHDFARRDVQPFHEHGDIGSGPGQPLAFDLQPSGRDVAHRRGLEMLPIFDVNRAAHLDSRHAPSLDRLADELTVDQRQHVDRLVETDADLALFGPIDGAGLALAVAEFDRDLASRGRFLIGNQRDAERRNFADRALACVNRNRSACRHRAHLSREPATNRPARGDDLPRRRWFSRTLRSLSDPDTCRLRPCRRAS